MQEIIAPKISVIVPVYNTEKYLRRCIDSILSQTFTDFELLLVDDGSKDDSGTICDEYAEKDPRVRVFHKENGGVSSARNLGLDEAKGDYTIFMDADDYYSINNGIETLYNVSIKCKADLVRGEYMPVDQAENELHLKDLNDWRKLREKYVGKVLQAEEFFVNVICGEFFLFLMLIRTSFAKRFRFPCDMIFLEDMFFFTQVLQQEMRCVYEPVVFYAYRKIQESASNRKDLKKQENSFGMSDVFEKRSKTCSTVLMRDYCRYYSVMMYCWTLDALSQEYKPCQWNECKRRLKLDALHAVAKKRIWKWKIFNKKSLLIFLSNVSLAMYVFRARVNFIQYKRTLFRT